MSLTLQDLPYPYDALEPHVSRTTLEIHHDKHHKAYVDKTNELVADTGLAGASLEEIVLAASGKPEQRALFNSAAQAWNHDFYWRSLSPAGGGLPGGELIARIESEFDGFDAFVDRFAATATGQFGSGWAWLVLDRGRLRVTQTGNADLPLVHGQVPLLTIDVWEHAYYLDYQNRRPEYVRACIDHLLNWSFAEANLERAESTSAAIHAPRRAAG